MTTTDSVNDKAPMRTALWNLYGLHCRRGHDSDCGSLHQTYGPRHSPECDCGSDDMNAAIIAAINLLPTAQAVNDGPSPSATAPALPEGKRTMTTTDSVKFKACPFCGGTDIDESDCSTMQTNGTQLMCNGCGALVQGYGGSTCYARAVAAWNQRPTAPAVLGVAQSSATAPVLPEGKREALLREALETIESHARTVDGACLWCGVDADTLHRDDCPAALAIDALNGAGQSLAPVAPRPDVTDAMVERALKAEVDLATMPGNWRRGMYYNDAIRMRAALAAALGVNP